MSSRHRHRRRLRHRRQKAIRRAAYLASLKTKAERRPWTVLPAEIWALILDHCNQTTVRACALSAVSSSLLPVVARRLVREQRICLCLCCEQMALLAADPVLNIDDNDDDVPMFKSGSGYMPKSYTAWPSSLSWDYPSHVSPLNYSSWDYPLIRDLVGYDTTKSLFAIQQ